MATKYDYYTMEQKGEEWEQDHIAVYGWGRYGRSSVLAGQAKKSLIDWADSEKEAMDKYPGIKWGNKWLDPQNTFDHLPDGPDFY